MMPDKQGRNTEQIAQDAMKYLLSLAGKEYWRDVRLRMSSNDEAWKPYEILVALKLIEETDRKIGIGEERTYRLTKGGYLQAKEWGILLSP